MGNYFPSGYPSGSPEEVTEGYLAPTAPQTVVNGSVSGTATFSQPAIGPSEKRVVCYLNSLSGTALYTFPVAFSNTPGVIATNQVAANVASASASAVTLTGAPSTGFLILEGH